MRHSYRAYFYAGVIFGEAGRDQLYGDAGDDILNGGLGNDKLFGDAERGARGQDTFVLALGAGTDKIMDFMLGEDFIGLEGGLSFGQLSFTRRGKDVLISAGDDDLARVKATTVDMFTESVFVTV